MTGTQNVGRVRVPETALILVALTPSSIYRCTVTSLSYLLSPFLPKTILGFHTVLTPPTCIFAHFFDHNSYISHFPTHLKRPILATISNGSIPSDPSVLFFSLNFVPHINPTICTSVALQFMHVFCTFTACYRNR